MTQTLPGTERFTSARDALAAEMQAQQRRRRAWGRLPSSRQYEAVARRWDKHIGTVLVRQRKGGYVYSPDRAVGVSIDFASVLAQTADAALRVLVRRADDAVSKYALQVWRTWPKRSGYSAAHLDIRWSPAMSAGGLKVEFASTAPYTFIAQATNRAWQTARRGWNKLAPTIVAEMNAEKLRLGGRHG